VESKQGIHHGSDGHKRKQASADLADAVTKVEEADGQAAEDDGEVEP
jgi:hypothetical protein